MRFFRQKVRKLWMWAKIENMMKSVFSRKKRFHLFKSLLYKSGKAEYMPLVAGRLVFSLFQKTYKLLLAFLFRFHSTLQRKFRISRRRWTVWWKVLKTRTMVPPSMGEWDSTTPLPPPSPLWCWLIMTAPIVVQTTSDDNCRMDRCRSLWWKEEVEMDSSNL